MSNSERILGRVLGGKNVTVLLTVEPTDLPWDGDEPLEENAEGWDVMAEATLDLGGSGKKSLGTVTAHASVCSTWILPDTDGLQYLNSVKDDIVNEAVQNLEEELARLAEGKAVASERRRQNAAKKIVATIPVEEVMAQ